MFSPDLSNSGWQPAKSVSLLFSGSLTQEFSLKKVSWGEDLGVSSSDRWECLLWMWECPPLTGGVGQKKGASINGQFREAFDGNFLGKKSFDAIFANCPNVAVAVSPLYNLLARHEGVRCVILRIFRNISNTFQIFSNIFTICCSYFDFFSKYFPNIPNIEMHLSQA